jgi:hypothetical protein
VGQGRPDHPRVPRHRDPNTETLYSTALLDLAEGPVVVVHPDFGDRYWLYLPTPEVTDGTWHPPGIERVD